MIHLPDPQDPAAFERSKLTRRRDAGLERLYRDLIAIRPALRPGSPVETEYDEIARWLPVEQYIGGES